MEQLSSTIFEKVDSVRLKNVIINKSSEKTHVIQNDVINKKRKLNPSYVRLMPKETGVRPIVNLRKRYIKEVSL